MKTEDPESKIKGRLNARSLASIKMVGLVCSWGREKRDRKIVDINIGFFVSGNQI